METYFKIYREDAPSAKMVCEDIKLALRYIEYDLLADAPECGPAVIEPCKLTKKEIKELPEFKEW